MVERCTIPRSAWVTSIEAWRTAAVRRRQRRRVLLILAGCAALGLPALLKPAPRLIWNASPSVPVGLYRVSPGSPATRGDIVVVRLPQEARRLAAARHYLPDTIPLVKRVAALPPDRVCTRGSEIAIGVTVAHRLPRDAAGRALPWWTGCRILKGDEVLLLAIDRPDSFDSRYFGPVRRRDLVGTASLLWRF